MTGNSITLHTQAIVFAFDYIKCRDGLPEAGPAGTRFKLGLRIEKCSVTANTSVNTLGMVVPVFAAKWCFRAWMAGHPKGIRRQQSAPFSIAFDNLGGLYYTLTFACCLKVFYRYFLRIFCGGKSFSPCLTHGCAKDQHTETAFKQSTPCNQCFFILYESFINVGQDSSLFPLITISRFRTWLLTKIFDYSEYLRMA